MPILTNVAAKAAMDAIADLVDVGSADLTGDLKFYDGTPPADADTALSGNTLLAEVDAQDPAFNVAADATPGAIVTLQGVPLSDLSIDATGTCTFARMFDRDNGVVTQFTVGESATDIIVNSDAFQIGALFVITSLTITHPES